MSIMSPLFNWRRRALVAENRLRQLGADRLADPVSDDRYLVATLAHQDGHEPVMVDDVNAARARLIEQGSESWVNA